MVTDIVENIKCYIDDEICDKAILYRKDGEYYIKYIGTGTIKKITQYQYELISINGYC